MNAPGDDFAKWRAMLAGEKVAIHEDEPICGYFRMRDRRGLNAHLAPIKRPWIAVAVWRDEAGELKAVLAKAPVSVQHIWPYYAHPKNAITYETYLYWATHERWPETEKAA